MPDDRRRLPCENGQDEMSVLVNPDQETSDRLEHAPHAADADAPARMLDYLAE